MQMKRCFSREAFNAKTIMEPFRVKTVQPIKRTTLAQREAALSVGASKFQTVFHHVVPLAMPGTLSGTIIG